uniref:U1-Austrotoxin-Ht1a_1 n=2 Tax=Hickmania troglodytes TaxID=489260 RepID=A0A482Z936_9ARAC
MHLSFLRGGKWSNLVQKRKTRMKTVLALCISLLFIEMCCSADDERPCGLISMTPCKIEQCCITTFLFLYGSCKDLNKEGESCSAQCSCESGLNCENGQCKAD